MKDEFDSKTTELLPPAPPKERKKPGRKPKNGEKAMSGAERAKLHREKVKAERDSGDELEQKLTAMMQGMQALMREIQNNKK